MTIYPTPKISSKIDYKECYELFDQTITTENVKRMGELIALSALKYSAIHSNYYSYLYLCLLKQIFNKADSKHITSDGYDYAQDAILFLCDFIGKKPSETYKIDNSGKVVSIRLACMRYVGKLIGKDKIRHTRDKSIEDMYVEPIYKETKEAEEQKERVRKIIRKMKLKKGEKDVLNCYIAGMTFVQIARFLKIDNSTVWKRRKRLQIKYNSNIK